MQTLAAIRSGKRLQFASLNMQTEMLDLPSYKMVISQSFVSLPKGYPIAPRSIWQSPSSNLVYLVRDSGYPQTDYPQTHDKPITKKIAKTAQTMAMIGYDWL